MSTIKNDHLLNQILDAIGGTEANGNYNAVWGNAHSQRDLSVLTVAEVLAQQQKTVRAGGQSATGRYQFIIKTLTALMKRKEVDQAGYKLTSRFTPELQDFLAAILLKDRGYEKYKAGTITDTQFGNELAKEWASFPIMDGEHRGFSFYHGDGLNKALITVGQVRAALAK